MMIIAGVDEAGRGPLAGPVVAAAVILPAEYDLPDLMDSKKLSAKKRESLFEAIQKVALAYAIAESSVAEIDCLNILQASLLAMHRAVRALSVQPQKVLVDGNQLPKWSYESEAVIGGDNLIPAISAASILAKVTRDRMMQDLHQQFLEYDFLRHKGYPTKAHIAALGKYGPSPHHRCSFGPVKRVLS